MTLHFGKLRRTLAWGQKGWFLLVLEPEPIVCEVKRSCIAYVSTLGRSLFNSLRKRSFFFHIISVRFSTIHGGCNLIIPVLLVQELGEELGWLPPPPAFKSLYKIEKKNR